MSGAGLAASFGAIAYVGTVKAVRQEYLVYRMASGDFVVFSRSSRSLSSYHMTIVPRGRAELLGRMAAKEALTSNLVLKDRRAADAFGGKDRTATRFDVLMTLYVLTAQGTLEMKKAGRSLVFTSRGGRP